MAFGLKMLQNPTRNLLASDPKTSHRSIYPSS
jgi:hypothetical protein